MEERKRREEVKHHHLSAAAGGDGDGEASVEVSSRRYSRNQKPRGREGELLKLGTGLDQGWPWLLVFFLSRCVALDGSMDLQL